jgi:hypothetical protein
VDASFHSFSVDYVVLNRANGFADAAQSDKYFVSARRALSKVAGMRENEWPAGWSYLAGLERKIKNSTEVNEKAGCLIQFFGFMRGIDEEIAEQRFVRYGGEMPDSEADRNIYRMLLAAVYGAGLDPQDIIGSPENAPAETTGIAGEISAVDRLVDQGIKGPAVREVVNPIIAEILNNGGVLPAKEGGDQTQARAISELFRMYDPLVDKKPKDAVVKKVDGALRAGAAAISQAG